MLVESVGDASVSTVIAISGPATWPEVLGAVIFSHVKSSAPCCPYDVVRNLQWNSLMQFSAGWMKE